MIGHLLPAFASAALLIAWGSERHFRVDESKRLPLPCKAESKRVADTWYVNVERHPDEADRFASGEFDARVTVWVSFKTGQQLVTVSLPASLDGAPIDTGEVSTGRMISGQPIISVDKPIKCEAFAARPSTVSEQAGE